MDISLITSLYHSDRFLGKYIERLLTVCAQIAQTALTLEVIVIANDATAVERQLIASLVARANGFIVKPFFIPRETLYASWNRAVKISSGECIAMWNVDDDRDYQALVEGYKLISDGCEIVDFPYTLVRVYNHNEQLVEKKRTNYQAFPYDEDNYHPLNRTRTGPFFMYKRSLYDAVGPFDERFKVCGDFDWTARASVRAKMCRGVSQAGRYFLHGNNLSMSDLLAVEENIIILRYGDQHGREGLQPVPPKLMRDTWAMWETKLPFEIEQYLWGTTRLTSYRMSVQYQFKKYLSSIREPLSRAVTKSRVRPLLASIGLVKSKIDPFQNDQPVADAVVDKAVLKND